jgi:hypothetical protein
MSRSRHSYDEFIRLEAFNRARSGRVQEAGIFGAADVQRYNFSVDRPFATYRSRDALTKGVTNEPPVPDLGHKRSVGAE